MHKIRWIVGAVLFLALVLAGCEKKDDSAYKGTSDLSVVMEVPENEGLTGYVPSEGTTYFLEHDEQVDDITAFVLAEDVNGSVTYLVAMDLLTDLGIEVTGETEDMLELKHGESSIFLEKDGNHYLVDGAEKSLSQKPSDMDGVWYFPIDVLYSLGYQELSTSRYGDSVTFSVGTSR